MQETVLEVVCEHKWSDSLQECIVCHAKSKDERVVIGRAEEVVREKV